MKKIIIFSLFVFLLSFFFIKSSSPTLAVCAGAGQSCGNVIPIDCCTGLSCSAYNIGTCVYCSAANNRDCIYGCAPDASGGTCKSAPTYDCTSTNPCTLHTGAGTGPYTSQVACNRDCTYVTLSCPGKCITNDPSSINACGGPSSTGLYSCPPTSPVCCLPKIPPTNSGLGQFSLGCGSGINTVWTLDCVFPLGANIITWLLLFSGITVVVFIIFGGIRFIFSGGDPKRIADARKVLIFAILGFLIILLSFAIIRTVAVITGVLCIDPNNPLSFQACR